MMIAWQRQYNIHYMSQRKVMQFSHSKKSPQEEENPRQSHSSLDKIQKKLVGTKLSNTFKHRKPNPVLTKSPQVEHTEDKKSVISQQWPNTNKRRYLKNYQLPKINSPTKLRRQEITEYDNTHPQDLIDDEQKLIQKKSFTLEANSPTKKLRLAPLKQNAKIYTTAVRTKAGLNGRQTKINQDIAIVEEKLPHGLKLYCVCDGHGLNGHLVSAFIKGALIKNLTGPLKKFHNAPERQKMIEIIYLALSTTNQQLLDSDINTELAGSTLIAVFVYNERLLAFNVGDSRAILLTQRKNTTFKESAPDPTSLPQLSHVKVPEEFEWGVFPLSVDQKPDRPDQRQRILKFGGRVFAQTNEQGQELGPARVWMKDVMMPGLAMTRSFGDKAGIKSGTNAEPELIEHDIEGCDKVMVVASDGVWEYLQNEDVMKLLVPYLNKNDLNGAAQALMRRAVQMWGKMNFARDDITFILVKLNEVQE